MFNYATKTQKINLLTKKSHKWNWEISANALKFKRIKIHLNFKGTKNRNFIALKQNANLDLKLKLRRNLPQITKTNSQLRLFWLQRQISFDFILKFYAPECAWFISRTYLPPSNASIGLKPIKIRAYRST